MKKGKQKKMFLLGIIVVLVIVLVTMLASLRNDPLRGAWNMDSVTAYHFDGTGKGAMVLPSAEYAFNYTVKGDVLTIDFESPEAKDAEYSFHISGDTLTLTGGNDTTKGEFLLKKSDKNP